LIGGEYIGIKTNKRKPVLIEDLMEDNYLDLKTDIYGIYIPEVKFLSEEVLVNYKNLSLIDYPNIHFVGDSLSSRGIAVSAAQGVYSVQDIYLS
jgi:uncharacterized FAD-dependent dehydrogenase